MDARAPRPARQQTPPRDRASRHRVPLRAAALVAATVLGCSVLSAGPALAAPPAPTAVVVAPGGDDAAAGTAAAPLATAAAAVRRLPDGGSVQLRSGRYAERVALGPDVHDLTIEPYDDEHPILDGSTLRAPKGRSAMVDVDSSRDVTVHGLEITGYDTVKLAAFPIGVYVHGGATGITVSDNHVHSMGNDNGTLGSFDLSAHGIAAYGDSVGTSITDLTISGNEVDHLALGASEAVVVNGNVDGWAITGNDVHDNNNIGIDAIGYELTLPKKHRYTDLNRARNGVIADNTVRNTISRGNPSYYEDGSWCNCADGVYVDGGTRIRVERNRLVGNDIGVEVAAENGRGSADHVLVANNEISRSKYTGIATGGYCDGGEGCGGEKTGRAHDNAFVNNTLFGNNTLDDGSAEITVQYYVSRTVLVDNVVSSTATDPTMIGTAENAGEDGFSKAPYLSDNLYFAGRTPADGVGFGLLGTTYTGFDAYRAATGADRGSLFADPLLVDPARGDLHLGAGSPAIDAGAEVPARYADVIGPYVTTDVDGDPRVSGARIDIGADEVVR